jgi:glycerol-3-phosphate dehydrogenase
MSATSRLTRFGSQHQSSMRRLASTTSAGGGQGGGSSNRRTMYMGTAAAVLVAGGVLTMTTSSLFAEDRSSYQAVIGDVRPHPLWSPPTRAQMIAALKESSGKSLRPQSNRVSRDNTSLQREETESTSSTPSPAARQDTVESDGLGRNGDEDGNGFDLLIIGGGATGAGVAVDAATRGLAVAMVEKDDFGAGTSSKSTKLIHGGVRYLQKAVFELDYDQYKMVREALHERKTFLHIAPYLSEHLPIMLPVYR